MTATRRWLVLCVVLMGTFMTILDVAIVNVAIPSIRADLKASFGEIEFVISAYTLTYACLLVTGISVGLASRLSISTDLSALLPRGYPSVEDLLSLRCFGVRF